MSPRETALFSRGSRRELAVAGPALALALVALAAGWLESRPAARTLAEWEARAAASYQAIWARLDDRAEVVKKALLRVRRSPEVRRTAFDALSHFAAVEEGQLTILLVDGDGVAQAWMGQGLVHEPEAVELPRSGHAVRAGFLNTTLLSVVPLDGERRPWRVVVGTSLASDRLPFRPPGGEPASTYRWSVVEPGTPPSAVEGLRLGGTGIPDLVLAPRPAPEDLRPRIAEPYRRLAWAALAVALLAVVVLRGVGWTLAETPDPALGLTLGVLSLLAAAAGSLASGAAPAACLALSLAMALLVAGCALAHRRAALLAAVVGGTVAAAGVLAAFFAYEQLLGRADLGSSVLPGSSAFCLRLAGTALTAGFLLLAVGRSSLASDDEGGPQLGAALTLVLAATVVLDFAELALPLLLAA